MTRHNLIMEFNELGIYLQFYFNNIIAPLIRCEMQLKCFVTYHIDLEALKKCLHQLQEGYSIDIPLSLLSLYLKGVFNCLSFPLFTYNILGKRLTQLAEFVNKQILGTIVTHGVYNRQVSSSILYLPIIWVLIFSPYIKTYIVHKL